MIFTATILLSGKTATGIEVPAAVVDGPAGGKLSYSKKQRFTLSIEQAKTSETRQRRVEKAINDLYEGRA